MFTRLMSILFIRTFHLQYLEVRFESKAVRLFGAFLFILKSVGKSADTVAKSVAMSSDTVTKSVVISANTVTKSVLRCHLILLLSQ